MSRFSHVPVLAEETLNMLAPAAGGIYIDGTLGGGGHTSLILAASDPDGRVLGIDRDDAALCAAGQRLAVYGQRFTAAKGNYKDMAEIAHAHGIEQVDGILLDIGVSSHQLDEADRGFSYQQDAPLDMRMDRTQALSAYDVVNTWSEEELTRILYEYGEERWSARVVRFILDERAKAPIKTTGQLADLVRRAIPAGAREKEQQPAARVFQAVRIAVNGELDALKQGLDAAVSLLRPGGILAIITFHSLEDRIVKERFRYHASGCICPPRQPICTCGHKPLLKLLNKKPITAGEKELAENPRSRSACLRAARKL